jgi:hypothetical protein
MRGIGDWDCAADQLILRRASSAEEVGGVAAGDGVGSRAALDDGRVGVAPV